jgi:hypothetical protein
MSRCVLSLLISSFLHQSLSGVLVTYNRIRGQRASGLLFLFWCFLALCGAVQYHHELTDVDSEQVCVCSKCRLSCVKHTHTHFYGIGNALVLHLECSYLKSQPRDWLSDISYFSHHIQADASLIC